LEPDQFKKLLTRYADGVANEEEKQLIAAWYDSYDRENEAEVFSDALKEELVRKEMQQAILNHRNPPEIRKFSFRQYYKYAAVLAIAISAVFLG
jgi:transmembrane sensor